MTMYEQPIDLDAETLACLQSQLDDGACTCEYAKVTELIRWEQIETIGDLEKYGFDLDLCDLDDDGAAQPARWLTQAEVDNLDQAQTEALAKLHRAADLERIAKASPDGNYWLIPAHDTPGTPDSFTGGSCHRPQQLADLYGKYLDDNQHLNQWINVNAHEGAVRTGRRGNQSDNWKSFEIALDLDVGDKGHSSKALPAHLDTVEKILSCAGIDSSRLPVIWSGHGAVAFIRLDEIHDLTDNNEHHQIIKRLFDVLQRSGRAIGLEDGYSEDWYTTDNWPQQTPDRHYKVDNIGDVARCRRVAGCINHKPNCEPVRSWIIDSVATDHKIWGGVGDPWEHVGDSYSVTELEELIQDAEERLPAVPKPTQRKKRGRNSDTVHVDGIDFTAAPFIRAANTMTWPEIFGSIGGYTQDDDREPGVMSFSHPAASNSGSVVCWEDGGANVFSDTLKGQGLETASRADALAFLLFPTETTTGNKLSEPPSSLSTACRNVGSEDDLAEAITTRLAGPLDLDGTQAAEDGKRIAGDVTERLSEASAKAGIVGDPWAKTPRYVDPDTGEVMSTSTEVAVPQQDPLTGEPLPPGSRVYKAKEGTEFTDSDWIGDWAWQSSDTMRRVWDAAERSGCSPDGVLGALLSLVGWMQPIQLALADYHGSPGNLNFIAGNVGISGKGKGEAMKRARELAGIDDRGMPTGRSAIQPSLGMKLRRMADGTGEKIVANFFRRASEDNKQNEFVFHYTNLFYDCDEGSAILDELNRNGSKFATTLLKLVSGTDALAETKTGDQFATGLPQQGYRFCAVINMQPSITDKFLALGNVGIPQRIIAFQCEVVKFKKRRRSSAEKDEHIKRKREQVRPLETLLPLGSDDLTDTHAGRRVKFITMTKDLRDRFMDLCDLMEFDRNEISPDEVQMLAEYGVSEETADIDGHRLLFHFKVAGLIAVMHGRSEVNNTDWDIATEVLRASGRAWQRAGQSTNKGNSRRETARGIRQDEASESATARDLAYGRMVRWLDKQPPDSVTRKSKVGGKGKPEKCFAIKNALITGSELAQLAIDDGVIEVTENGCFTLGESANEYLEK